METPPPEASPVKPVELGSSTPKMVPKKIFKSQIGRNHPNKGKISQQTDRNEMKIDVKNDEREEMSNVKVSIFIL